MAARPGACFNLSRIFRAATFSRKFGAVVRGQLRHIMITPEYLAP